MTLRNTLGSLSFLIITCLNTVFSQNESTPVYPQVKGYVSTVHPIVSFDDKGTTFNFDNSYTVLFPCGINILKSDRIGFSFEIAPTLKIDNVSDRISSFLFHPGIMFRYGKGFTFVTRAAFDTGGRYGFTPVFSKVLIKKLNYNYFIAAGLPCRFGNNQAANISLAIQLGLSF